MRFIKGMAAILLIAGMAACGGGKSGSTGTTPGTGGTTPASASLTVSLSSSTATPSAPVTVSATLKDAAGAGVSGQVVSFSSPGGLGAFSVTTALTDSTGLATTSLSPKAGASNGADQVVASVTYNGTALTASQGFQVTGISASGAASMALTLSSSTVTAAAPVTVTATITDSTGAGVAGQVVSFASPGDLGLFSVNSALTNASGVATTSLSPNGASANGADQVVATATYKGSTLTASQGFQVTGGTSGTASLTLALSSTTVTGGAPVTVTATLKDGTGAGVAGQVISFTTPGGLGTFSVNSALTNASGAASVTLSPKAGASSGADQVVAAVTYNGTSLTATQGFQLTASNVSITSFTSDLGGSALSAYGQTNLTAVVTGATASAQVSLNVSSACVTAGKATLTPSAASTSTGTATFTYRDQGCGATAATDSLQVSVVGTSATSSLSIPLTSPTVQSITFVSATPTTIYLKGSGLTETSTVAFKVLDTAGNGLPNQSVTLAPNTLAGGLTLDGGSATVAKLSDGTGTVTALVNSGTVPTPVRIRATLTGSAISTVSSSLSVAVGLPSELNFSLSQTTKNIEGFNIDGTPNAYNIIASDRLANPVPDGTAINFIAEGGQVEPIKFTALQSGLSRASANFISASPRPVDGRVTILAYALGEESFLDQNGNNVFDTGEPFQDLGNIFLSRSFNKAGDYVNTEDQFIALSITANATCAAVDPTKDPANLLALDRSIPTIPGTCDGVWGRAYVRRAIETVLSTSSARPVWASKPANLYLDAGAASCATVTLQSDYAANGAMEQAAQAAIAASNPALLPAAMQNTFNVVGSGQLANLGATGSFSFVVADANGFRLNPMAAGTTVTASSPTSGLSASVIGGSPVPSSLDATFVTISYTFTAPTTSGTIILSFKSPSGLITGLTLNVNSGATGTGLCP